MKKCATLIILLFLFQMIGSGQRTLLMLQKKNKNKTVYYGPGEVITFQVKDIKSKISGEIVAIKDSTIYFKGFDLPVNKITCVYIDEKTKWWLRYKLAQLSFIVGGGYLLLDVINTGELKKETLFFSGAVIGVGLIAKLLISNKIKIGKSTRLRIIRIS